MIYKKHVTDILHIFEHMLSFNHNRFLQKILSNHGEAGSFNVIEGWHDTATPRQ